MKRVLPAYLTIDTSASMHERIPEIEDFIDGVISYLLEEPLVAEVARVSVVTFGDRASLALPLSDLTSTTRLPAISAGGGTMYAPAFDLLRDVITKDIRFLRAHDAVVQRPLIIFITDGAPIDPPDEWMKSFRRLMDTTRPIVVPIALPGSDPTLLGKLAEGRVVAAEHLGDARGYLRSLLASTVRSVAIVDTGEGPSTGLHPTLRFPDVEVW